MHCVDLGESFHVSSYNLVFTVYLQNVASIQPRTSLVKFARSPRTDPPGLAYRADAGIDAWGIDQKGRLSRHSPRTSRCLSTLKKITGRVEGAGWAENKEYKYR